MEAGSAAAVAQDYTARCRVRHTCIDSRGARSGGPPTRFGHHPRGQRM